MKLLPLTYLLAALVLLPACQGDVQEGQVPSLSQDQQENPPPPDFSLASGVYEGAQELELSVPSGTKVYYTTDGTTPTSQSSEYTDPILLKPGIYTYQIVAIDETGQKSQVMSRSFQITSPDTTQDDTKEASPAQGQEAYDVIQQVQGLWATAFEGKLLLFHFEGQTLKIGPYASEWSDTYPIELLEAGTNGGKLQIGNESVMTVDAGKPKDNKIHLIMANAIETFDYGDVIYVSDSLDVLADGDRMADIYRNVGLEPI